MNLIDYLYKDCETKRKKEFSPKLEKINMLEEI